VGVVPLRNRSGEKSTGARRKGNAILPGKARRGPVFKEMESKKNAGGLWGGTRREPRPKKWPMRLPRTVGGRVSEEKTPHGRATVRPILDCTPYGVIKEKSQRGRVCAGANAQERWKDRGKKGWPPTLKKGGRKVPAFETNVNSRGRVGSS